MPSATLPNMTEHTSDLLRQRRRQLQLIVHGPRGPGNEAFCEGGHE